MSDLALIPFGLRLIDRQLVDVSEVDRGIKCRCICPSCSTPLLAKQGDIKEWHFAHASKGVSESTKKECEYSFWVSVTLMAKQVISTAHSISLPSLTMYLRDGKEVQVTKQQVAEVDEVKLEKNVSHVYADAVLSIGKYVIAVVFTAPHKLADKYIPQEDQSRNIGVLEISLAKACEWLFRNKINGEYTKKISHHIINDVENKKWLFHPRVKYLEKEYNAELLVVRPTKENKMIDSSYCSDSKNYVCRICGHRWYGTYICPECNTHLYSSEQKNA